MADVTYNTDMFPALLRTLDALLKLPRLRRPLLTDSVSPPSEDSPSSSLFPLVLLAYKERHEAERTLFTMCRSQYNIEFILIDKLDRLMSLCIGIVAHSSMFYQLCE